ncbi:MAG: hypothetical protein IJD59_03420 [Clostridia bacterium]|nr:hypothetical protein [Clostridia bacterium]
MKRKLCLIFVLIFTLSALLSPSAFAEGISLYNNNVDTTTTSFSITDTGEAQVMAAYSGYSGVTTGATICIKIEKRNLLIFWNEVVNDVYYFREESHAETFVYQLEKKGTYRCTVDYLISGNGGTDDEITFQDTKTY